MDKSQKYKVLLFVFLALLLVGACQPESDNSANSDGDADADADGDADGDGDADADGDSDGDRHGDDTCTDVIDLVFVLDVSSSMGFVLDQLESQINEVVVAANELADDSHFGLIAFVDNHAIDESGALEGGLIHTEATTLQSAFSSIRRTYTNPNRNPGDGPSGPRTQNPICEENALDALYAAANDFPWRENATRVVILATDDTFLERPDNYGDRNGDGLTDRSDFPREGDYPALFTLSETIEALQEARVRVFSFTRISVPGLFSSSRCGTPRRLPWESITHGWTEPYNGQTPIPEATDAENFDIDQVRDGSLSLTATINEIVVDSYCHDPIY